MKVYRNTISHFQGSWGSGIAFLVFENGEQVPGDNGPMARALDQYFWCIDDGHGINNTLLKGQDIIYIYDDFGLILGGLLPYEDWLDQTGLEIESGGSIEFEPDAEQV